jgi:hypothetical protein
MHGIVASKDSEVLAIAKRQGLLRLAGYVKTSSRQEVVVDDLYGAIYYSQPSAN